MEPVGVAQTTPSPPKPGHRAAVDLGDDLQQAFAGRLLHRRLVERPVGVHDAAVVAHQDVEGHPLLDLVLPGDDPVHDLVEVVALGLGEEADPAEVDAEHRHPGGAGELGAAQQGAVAAQHDDQLAALRPSRARSGRRVPPSAGSGRSAASSRQQPHPDTAAQQAVHDPLGAADRRVTAGVGEQEDGTVAGSVALHRSTGPLRHSSVDVGRVQRGGAGAQPQKVLHVPGRPGQRAGGDARAPPARARRPVPATFRTLSARSWVLRTTPPLPSRSLPTSNCGLTISTKSASGAAQRTSAGSTRPSGMNDRSPTTRSTGPAVDRLQRQLAHVGAVLDGDPRRRSAATRRAGRIRRPRRPPRRRPRAAARR